MCYISRTQEQSLHTFFLWIIGRNMVANNSCEWSDLWAEQTSTVSTYPVPLGPKTQIILFLLTFHYSPPLRGGVTLLSVRTEVQLSVGCARLCFEQKDLSFLGLLFAWLTKFICELEAIRTFKFACRSQFYPPHKFIYIKN